MVRLMVASWAILSVGLWVAAMVEQWEQYSVVGWVAKLVLLLADEKEPSMAAQRENRMGQQMVVKRVHSSADATVVK